MTELEQAMATYSSTLAWKIPWTEEPGRLQCMGSLRTEWLHFRFLLSCIGEGNGNPLQYSCLENPRDGGAWWAAVYGVAQSQIRLKRLSSSSSRKVSGSDCFLIAWLCPLSPWWIEGWQSRWGLWSQVVPVIPTEQPVLARRIKSGPPRAQADSPKLRGT